MIDVNNIQYYKPIYYVPTYGGALKVSIGKRVNTNWVIVKPYSEKRDFKAFPIILEYVYDNPIVAKMFRRDWEHWKRKRRKKRIKEKKID